MTRAYFFVAEGCALPQAVLEQGVILEVDAAALPADLVALERIGRVQRLPDPGALLPWFQALGRFRPVDARTFEGPRPKPAPPVYLTEDEVLARLDWTVESLRWAQASVGFPRHVKTRDKIHEDGHVEIVARLYHEPDVLRWEGSEGQRVRWLVSAR